MSYAQFVSMIMFEYFMPTLMLFLGIGLIGCVIWFVYDVIRGGK
jgi:uncharacterized membrane protein YesL